MLLVGDMDCTLLQYNRQKVIDICKDDIFSIHGLPSHLTEITILGVSRPNATEQKVLIDYTATIGSMHYNMLVATTIADAISFH